MASGGTEEDDGSIQLDIDNVQMLLQGESVCVMCCSGVDYFDVGSTAHQILIIFR